MTQLTPIHEGLPLLAEHRFQSGEAPYALVTFLNQTLKRRGYIFGLRRTGPGEYCLSIYDTAAAGGAAPTADRSPEA